jgi:beta-barrel assembly-enhancing protease
LPTPSTSPLSEARVAQARLHDGRDARTHVVGVASDGAALHLRGDEHDEQIAMAVLRRGHSAPAGLTLHRTDAPDWRLIVAPGSDFARDLPRLGSWRPWQRGLAIAGTILGVATVAGIGWGGDALVGRLAPLIPHAVTAPIGRQLVTGLGPACTGRAGRAALGRLATRLASTGEIAEPLTLTVINSPIVNAAALPGGEVVIFRGLIDEATGPGEVAGVLAHEIGHVARAHVNKGLIRQLGLSVLTGGSDAAAFVNLALLLRATRTDEAEADGEAIRRLSRAGWATTPLADFFDRQRRKPDRRGSGIAGLDDYAATHPPDAARAARFRAASIVAPAPVLDPAAWQALRMICRHKPQQRQAVDRPSA